MNGQQIQSKIISMEIDVLKAVRQRTLDQLTEGPFVKEARLFFLLLPFFNGEQWSDKMETSARTVAIVYAALHAHDRVKEEMPISKEQQLTVLAGDFYSGIYYQLLAEGKSVKEVTEILFDQHYKGFAQMEPEKAFHINLQAMVNVVRKEQSKQG